MLWTICKQAQWTCWSATGRGLSLEIGHSVSLEKFVFRNGVLYIAIAFSIPCCLNRGSRVQTCLFRIAELLKPHVNVSDTTLKTLKHQTLNEWKSLACTVADKLHLNTILLQEEEESTTRSSPFRWSRMNEVCAVLVERRLLLHPAE